jgi:hypothetical protein
MRILIAVLRSVIAAAALADGYTFRNGRFPEGKVTLLTLTEHQKQVIALYARCRNQDKTPFIFRLTKAQASKLKHEAGFMPERFQIYDSFGGETEAEYGYNYIVRFSETEFEVAHKVLLPEKELRDWETKIIGWAPSPLANADPSRYKDGKCPL